MPILPDSWTGGKQFTAEIKGYNPISPSTTPQKTTREFAEYKECLARLRTGFRAVSTRPEQVWSGSLAAVRDDKWHLDKLPTSQRRSSLPEETFAFVPKYEGIETPVPKVTITQVARSLAHDLGTDTAALSDNLAKIEKAKDEELKAGNIPLSEDWQFAWRMLWGETYPFVEITLIPTEKPEYVAHAIQPSKDWLRGLILPKAVRAKFEKWHIETDFLSYQTGVANCPHFNFGGLGNIVATIEETGYIQSPGAETIAARAGAGYLPLMVPLRNPNYPAQEPLYYVHKTDTSAPLLYLEDWGTSHVINANLTKAQREEYDNRYLLAYSQKMADVIARRMSQNLAETRLNVGNITEEALRAIPLSGIPNSDMYLATLKAVQDCIPDTSGNREVRKLARSLIEVGEQTTAPLDFSKMTLKFRR